MKVGDRFYSRYANHVTFIITKITNDTIYFEREDSGEHFGIRIKAFNNVYKLIEKTKYNSHPLTNIFK